MMHECDLPAEFLLAYGDGYLAGARRELVEIHLQTCQRCRERLAAFREVDDILRAGTPLLDAPWQRKVLQQRLIAASRSSPRRLTLRTTIVAVAALLLVAVLVARPSAMGAGFPLGAFVREGIERIQRFPGADQTRLGEHTPHPEGTRPAATGLSFRPVEPERLPLGLVRAERVVSPTGRLELVFRAPDGVAVLLAEEPARAGQVVRNPGDEAVVAVGDVEVLWLKDPRSGAVAGLLWERAGVFFEVLVVQAPPGGLALEDAVGIVAAVIAAQDAG